LEVLGLAGSQCDTVVGRYFSFANQSNTCHCSNFAHEVNQKR
jgi:hypothetical protein